MSFQCERWLFYFGLTFWAGTSVGQSYHYMLSGDTVLHGYERLILSADSSRLYALSTTNSSAGQYDIKVSMVETDLSTPWTLIYDGGWSDFGGSIVELSNGDIIVAGTSETDQAIRHGFMMRVSSAGDTLWTRNYLGFGGFNGLHRLDGDTLIATGWLNNLNGCTQLFQSNGDPIWSSPGSLSALLHDPRIAVRQDTLFIYSYVNTGNNTALYLGLYDVSNNGGLIDQHLYDWSSFDWPGDMLLENDRILLTANSQSLAPPRTNMLISVDLSGQIQWWKTFTDTISFTSSTIYTEVDRILKLPDGYFISGHNSYYFGLNSDTLHNISIMKLDNNLNLISIENFGTDSLETTTDILVWNESLYGCGIVKLPSGIYDDILFRIDSINHSLFITATSALADNIVYPNPTARYLWVKDHIDIDDELVVLNAMGKVVFTFRVDHTPFRLDFRLVPDGWYTVCVRNANRTWSSKVLVHSDY